jgi:hypothetical protein
MDPSKREANPRALQFERAAAAVAGWPRAVRSQADVDAVVARSSYLGEGKARHLAQAAAGHGQLATTAGGLAGATWTLAPRCDMLDAFEAGAASSTNGGGGGGGSLERTASSGWTVGTSAGKPMLRPVANAAAVNALASVLGVGLKNGTGAWLSDLAEGAFEEEHEGKRRGPVAAAARGGAMVGTAGGTAAAAAAAEEEAEAAARGGGPARPREPRGATKGRRRPRFGPNAFELHGRLLSDGLAPTLPSLLKAWPKYDAEGLLR